MPLKIDPSWRHSIIRFAVIASFITGLGIWQHRLVESLLVFFAVYFFITLWKVNQLILWLRNSQRTTPSQPPGIWNELYSLLVRRERHAFLRKRRLVARLRAFRDAAAALPDATVLLDSQQRIVWFNPSAMRLLDLKYPQDIDGYFSNLVRSPRIIDWLNQAEQSEPLLDVPAPGNDSLRLSLRLIRYTSDQSLLVARDVSNLSRLEQMRRDFIANVSHELRTPLTVIHGYLDLIDPEQLPEWAMSLRELRRQSSRMAQIVEDLLTLSHLEAQQQAAQERINMRNLFDTLAREAHGLSQGKHQIILENTCHWDLTGSIQELHSAFSNLISNAVRYTPAGGQIHIRWLTTEQGADFVVSDTGQGISPQHIPRITERFYRVSTSRSRETGGTGLGLSIVKHVLSLHQAKLKIESTVGLGSTFRCVFGAERLVTPE